MFSAFFRSLKQEFAGYNSKKLLADMMAGLTARIVALPLALAFGVSSGASAASGLVMDIIAGAAYITGSLFFGAVDELDHRMADMPDADVSAVQAILNLLDAEIVE